MSLTKDARDKLGYTKHPEDVANACFYCGNHVERDYFDYAPPRDVKSDPELAALVTVPYVYVTACHPCKSKLYPVRYVLKTPEERRARIQARLVKNTPNKALIRQQLLVQTPKLWQTTMYNAQGHPFVVDRPDYELSEEAAEAKTLYLAQESVPKTESPTTPASGPDPVLGF